MTKFMKTLLTLVILAALSVAPMLGVEEIKKTFTGKDAVKLQTMSGNCVVKGGSGGDVVVHLVYTPRGDMFKPQLREDGNAVILGERMGGEDSVWTITLPANTSFRFSSVSGSVSASGVKTDKEFSAKSVSGDITIKNSKAVFQLNSVNGDLELENLSGTIDSSCASSDMIARQLSGVVKISCSSGDVEARDFNGNISVKVASGDIGLENGKGVFKIKAASGDVTVSGIEITGDSYFKAASGDVNVSLAKTPAHNLTLASASGDAILDFKGNPVKGWFQFKALVNSGSIVCPFKFDDEKIEEKWNKKYYVKSFSKDGDEPKIYIYTSTGNAVLKK